MNDFADDYMTSSLIEDSPVSQTSPVLEDLVSGLIQSKDTASGHYGPKLISNRPGNTMGEALSEELSQSDAFDISVAFVSAEAVRSLFEDFREAASRISSASNGAAQNHTTSQQNIPAQSDATVTRSSRLITSTKNYFNRPSAFWDLLRLKDVTNIDVRIWDGRNRDSNNSNVNINGFANNENACNRNGAANVGANDATSTSAGQPFHPKGYIFTRHMDDGSPYYNVYVGSSNLTQYALERQREWNLKLSSLADGDLIDQFRRELDAQISESVPLTEDWIRQYEEDFKKYAPPRREILKSSEYNITAITPNAMQREALMNLAELREAGERRAIIISATGTGKTYLSAFDVNAVKPRRMLYVAGRQEILRSAMKSYQKVLHCSDDELGLLSGGSRQSDRKYVFATAQSLSRPEVLNTFASDEFDYILIDEAHHVGAASYKSIIDHFDGADFMLGMTATPERTDGVNIFEWFDHNIAYEIRLQKALDEDMLCPFHYYGVAEYLGSPDDGEAVSGNIVDNGNDISARRITVSQDMSNGASVQLNYEIQQLASADRVQYIIDILQQYAPYHQQITGLVFCSSIEEAQALSDLFNQHYNQQAERLYRTMAVTGKTSETIRESAIRRLEEDEHDEDSLDYIFTVDLFNEGIDIPSVNQIVMLRNTQSSIVFTQQLGRGLRKFPHKDSVIVIDFIGNYANNFLIPVALYGNTGDRDIARKNLQRRSIGLSSISFDAISRERVLASLDAADWSDMNRLTEQYRQLKYQLGRIPLLMDVYAHDASLPYTMAAKSGSYYSFVRSRERKMLRKSSSKVAASKTQPAIAASSGTDISNHILSSQSFDAITDVENSILKMATELLLPGLRPHELVILQRLCGLPRITGFLSEDRRAGLKFSTASSWTAPAPASFSELAALIAAQFPNANLDDVQLNSALRVLDYSYFTATNRNRFGGTPLITVNDSTVRISDDFAAMLANNQAFRMFFADTVRTGLLNCRDLHSSAQTKQHGLDRGFLYEQKYSLADVMRLLGWQNEMNGQNVGGYFRHRDTGTMPIFVKYATSQYEDQFLNLQEMRYFGKNGRSLTSPEFQWLTDGLDSAAWDDTHFVPLFVMRKEEENEKNKRYYYVGYVASVRQIRETTKPDAAGKKIVKVVVANLRLAQPLDPELYRHLTGRATA